MCLAVPLRVREINGAEAVCESFGVTRRVRMDLLPDAAPGDYVMVHAGFAIERVDKAQARADIDAFRELEEALRG